jgi:hypothetical protein
MGFITATVPIFQAECSSAKARGPMVAILGSLIAAGIALSYWIDFAFFFIDSSASWRAPIALYVNHRYVSTRINAPCATMSR